MKITFGVFLAVKVAQAAGVDHDQTAQNTQSLILIL